MASLDRIQVKGFKSIRELDLELRPLNVLIGANGSGKSNLIQVFEMLNYIVNDRFTLYVSQSGGADNLLYFGQRMTKAIELNIHIELNQYYLKLVPTNNDALIFENEEFHSERGLSEFGSSDGQSILVHPFGPVAKFLLENINNWKIYQFHDTSDSAKIKKTNDLNDNRFLREDGSNLAAYLYYLREKENVSYQRIVKTIQLVAPFFDDFVLQPERLNPETIRLLWSEKNSPPDMYFNASALSDGTLRFIALATLLLQPDLPSTVLIDEPELGLHPYAITVLGGLLRSASTQTQVIVATQSVSLMNQFDLEDIILVDRKDGQSTFERRNPEEFEKWLEDFSLGELWEKNLIGGRPQR